MRLPKKRYAQYLSYIAKHRLVSGLGKWTMLAHDSLRFLAPYVEVFMQELVDHAQRNYPGRDLIGAAPPLHRPPEPRTSLDGNIG